MASMRKGWFSATARRRASLVALYTANTSLPSTRIDMMPYPGPRAAAGQSGCRSGLRERAGGRAARRALTYAVPTVLLRGWCGDGVAIVPAEEDDGTLQGGSEVETGVGIPFTGRPLAKVTDHNLVGIGPLGSIGCPDRCMGTWMRGVGRSALPPTHTHARARTLRQAWKVVSRYPGCMPLPPGCHAYIYTTVRGQPDLDLPLQGQATARGSYSVSLADSVLTLGSRPLWAKACHRKGHWATPAQRAHL